MRLSGILFNSFSKLPKHYANLPQKFIDRVMKENFTEFETPKGRQYLRKVIKKTKFNYGMHRPWTDEFKKENEIGTTAKKVFVKPLAEFPVLRGDRVEILAGKDKGKQGIVNYVVEERNWVTVEGLNCDYKYMGATKNYPGVMYKDEQPLNLDEIALVDPSDNKATEMQWRFSEEGEKVRISVRTGRIIPIPITAFETMDYKDRAYYPEQEKDTKAADVEKITFEPKLLTFQQEIMLEMGIKEDRKPSPSYWY